MMQYNLFGLEITADGIAKIKEEAGIYSANIHQKLDKLAQLILDEYLMKQVSKKGIKNLGNEIRYNKKIEELFAASSEEILIKLTENKRSFLNVFIDSIDTYRSKDIYFLILEKNFGSLSQIVDKTFISIRDIEGQIEKLSRNFSFRKKNSRVFFVEFKGIKDYFISQSEGYSKIIPHKK